MKSINILRIVLIVALILSVFFVPQSSRADLTLPTTGCDSAQANAAHLTSGMSLEDETRAFTYGQNFASKTNGVVTLNFDVLFGPAPSNVVKIYFMDVNCTVVAGYAFQQNMPVSNTFSYDTNTDNLTFDQINTTLFANGVPRYIWAEVWDGIRGSSFASYSYVVDLNNPVNPSGTPAEPPEVRLTPDPVIIIPGILGSEQKNGVWLIDPILHIYDNLIETLKANGYQEDYDLFTFPYDWRKSNVETAVALKLKIQEARNLCACDKVDLVAHSMGGLVARQYIQSDQYDHDVDQLIFLSTPHLGSVDAYLTWEGGEVRPSKTGFISKFLFEKEAKKQGFFSLFSYVRAKIPSMQQLLPVFDYLRDKDTDLVRTYPRDYPRNIFLEDLNQNLNNLLNSGINITNIVGKTADDTTIRYLRVVDPLAPIIWYDGYPENFLEKIGDRGLETGAGDGTVPENSSMYISNDLEIIESQHDDLPTKAESNVFNKLTGRDPETFYNEFNVPNLKLLIIKMLSPADMMVVAPDGKKIGKDFVFGGEINEIDNAFYSGFETDDEYITILNPLDGDYQVKTLGTGSGGEYTVASAFISDSFDVEKDFTAQTAPRLIESAILNISNANHGTLDIKPSDTTPPQITVASPRAEDYLRSASLSVNVSVTDFDSGVFSNEFKLDNITVVNNSSIDLFLYKLGDHQLSVNAMDYVGNSANSQVNFRITATLDSTVSDIKRVYSLGWIDNKGIKESLIEKLKKRKEKEDSKKEHKKEKERDEKEQKERNQQFKEILKELNSQRGKHVNEQAYQIILEDINWLTNN